VPPSSPPVSDATKRRFLVDQYGIPEDHIFSTRSTDFAAGCMRLTGGEGVDVVLNTLIQNRLQASWECVAKFGIFIEMGKIEIYRRSHLSMESLDRNVRFASVDLAVLARYRQTYAQKLLQRVFSHVKAGGFSPLPVVTLPISDIEKAFRLIQAEKTPEKSFSNLFYPRLSVLESGSCAFTTTRPMSSLVAWEVLGDT